MNFSRATREPAKRKTRVQYVISDPNIIPEASVLCPMQEARKPIAFRAGRLMADILQGLSTISCPLYLHMYLFLYLLLYL